MPKRSHWAAKLSAPDFTATTNFCRSNMGSVSFQGIPASPAF
jgi:hypothetical protein